MDIIYVSFQNSITVKCLTPVFAIVDTWSSTNFDMLFMTLHITEHLSTLLNISIPM